MKYIKSSDDARVDEFYLKLPHQKKYVNLQSRAKILETTQFSPLSPHINVEKWCRAHGDPSNFNSTLIKGRPGSLSLAISLTIFAPDCS